MADVLIRNLSDRTLKALKRRAKLHHTSLQEELKIVLDDVARTTMFDAESTSQRIFESLQRKGIRFSDSGEMQAEDRLR
jgi:plasmid stability protein